MTAIITDTPSLAAFCERMKSSDFLAIDTEFMREKTYYPILCLVQVAGEHEAAAIDALAPGIDLTPLHTLLTETGMPKVFHAARQDVEIFYTLSGKIPSPMYDTQVAAQVCGYGESAGYESLVNGITGKSLDKSARFTDWSHRPLTEKQLRYALDDVIYLREVYRELRDEIIREGRESWIEEEMRELSNPSLYVVDPALAWKRLKSRSQHPRVLACLKCIAEWRELEARKKNIPRGRILKDEVISEIAQSNPRSMEELRKIRSLGSHLSNAQWDALFGCIEKSRELPASDFPRSKLPPELPDGSEGILDLLRLLLKLRADAHHVTPRLVADRDELEALIRGEKEGLHCMHGWRFEIFGRDALDLLNGKLSIKVMQGRLTFQ